MKIDISDFGWFVILYLGMFIALIVLACIRPGLFQ